MIKNETKINHLEGNHLLNSISDKENKNEENISELYSDQIESVYSKSGDKKKLLINNNTIQETTLENQTTANKNNSNNKNININKSNIYNHSTYFTSKGKTTTSIDLNTTKQLLNLKPFYSAFSAKNIFNMFSPNAEVSSFNLINKSTTPTNRNLILNKLNKENIHNFISTTKSKAFFGSLLFKNHSYKNISKNQMNKDNKNNINNKEKNNNIKILMKYSKEYKNNMNNKEDKLNDILEKIKIKKNENENEQNKINQEIPEQGQENDVNNNANKNKKNKIPFNQEIFNKIIDEVKDEKNYIQKVVHRKLMNQRECYRNSLQNNNLKKYDTNTYNKEITTKKIRNPFNTSLNKDLNENNINRNYSMKRNLNIKNKINESNENNKLNKSCANISNKLNNNLNDEIINKKKNSIKIKKIPLNKLKHKIQVNNPIITNYIFTNEKNINLYNDMNCNTQRIILNKNNNIRYSDNIFNNYINNNYSYSKNYQRTTEIPKQNNSLYGIQNLNLDNIERDNKQNILYNKVNLRKRASKKIKINLNTNLYPVNQNNTQGGNNMNNISSYNYDNNGNNDNNKLLQEKKIGLFKKKLAGLSSDKQNKIDTSFSYLSMSNINKNKKSNIYNKKLNNTIFKSYITNQYLNNNLNDSYINNNNYMNKNRRHNINSTFNNNLTNINKRINTTDSMTNYDSKYNNITTNKIKNINYKNLRNDIFFSEYESTTSLNYTKEEIKLEQIITLLNFEDLLIIEDKLNTVLNKLKQDKITSEEFFDLFNYFFSSSLKPKFEQIYKYLLAETEAIKIFINHSLILIIISYDFSLNKNNNNSNIKFSLYESMRLIYINLLMIISPLKNKIKNENKDYYNLRLIEMSGISNIIDKNLINFNNNIDNDEEISFNRELLHNNTNLLIKNISLIIKNYKQNIISELYFSIKTNNNSLDDINTFFRQNILREDFIGCSVLASTFLKEKENFSLSPIPYITNPSSKKYSLVLDLDETLIHFRVNHTHNDEGVLKLRPGVGTFFQVIKEFYEIILFTEASEAYTELIIEAFNKNNFFDYKFYRQHTIIIGHDFVKDLQRIGRPLDKIIIIDNIQQNFRMQKNNGILIKPFYGEDQNDQALIDLIPILINIAKDNIDTRNGLVKYRDEIMTKITSNLFRRNNDKM